MQPDQDDDLSPGEILDDLRRRCLAYVAEHYEPVGADEEIADEDYIGTNHDPEHVWDEALQSVLGPDEWWDRWARTPDVTKLSEEEVDRYATVALAWIAVAAVGKKAVRELEHQERLFGKVAENPRCSRRNGPRCSPPVSTSRPPTGSGSTSSWRTT
jgi:hypothetical protein